MTAAPEFRVAQGPGATVWAPETVTDDPYNAQTSIGYEELLTLEHHELDVVVECAGNGRSLMRPPPPGLPWSQRAVGCAHFAGVPFRLLADRAGIDPAAVEDVVFGCLDTVGPQAGDIARTAWLAAGLPEEVQGVTVDHKCGS
ncbi:molybdopterin-dependent oxidoreductase, partial [Streptomyces xiamenensis]|uniref:molybdopterin-dependent oxidoreductase n=1 Tax=Streptomyces xiamenensis TaxID=408015 RepID=UPI0035DC1542